MEREIKILEEQWENALINYKWRTRDYSRQNSLWKITKITNTDRLFSIGRRAKIKGWDGRREGDLLTHRRESVTGRVRDLLKGCECPTSIPFTYLCPSFCRSPHLPPSLVPSALCSPRSTRKRRRKGGVGKKKGGGHGGGRKIVAGVGVEKESVEKIREAEKEEEEERS